MFFFCFIFSDETNQTEENSKIYSAEYAKSNRSTCQGCKMKIDKDLVRLSYKVSTVNQQTLNDHWYHIDCFKQHKDDISFNGSAETFVFVFH